MRRTWAVVLGLVAAAAAGLLAMPPQEPSGQPAMSAPGDAQPATPATATQAQGSAAAVPHPRDTGGAPDAPTPAPEQDEPGRESRPQVAAPPPLPTRPEIEQLAAIRAALASDPARAYELAQRGHTQFPAGALHEQREGLAILALSGSERRGEAQKRAAAFRQRYPSSPLLTEIGPIVFGPPED